MKKEIGGYFELEELMGQEYYPDLYKVNLGRTALLWLLESGRCQKLYLPYFMCDSVTEACQEAGIPLEFYWLNTDLTPQLSLNSRLPEGEYIYICNFYGQLTDEQILKYRNLYVNIIIDHTHAFFHRPLPGIDTLYSCRKFFGLSDGAYLATDAVLTSGKEQDHSYDRLGHILGRYEVDAGTFYRQMLENADQYHHMGIRTMSKLTENLLRGIDYSTVKKRREDNYAVLRELLPSENPFTKITPDGPFCYPYYHPQGMALRKQLAAEKIFVPTYWSNILKEIPEDRPEYDWAANILPLPCDQRYDPQDMRQVAEAVRRLEHNSSCK